MENQKNNKGVIALLVVIIVILSALCILFATGTINLKSNAANNNNQVSEPTGNELGKYDTFSAINESGIVEVIGYSETIEKEVPSMYENAGEKYYYVYFHIKQTKSDEFNKFVESLKENSFASDNAIGLGCVNDGIITYFNSSDEFGDKEYKISQEDSDKILNSTENNPIKLKLERLVYNSGKGDAPYCYSHITKVEIEN